MLSAFALLLVASPSTSKVAIEWVAPDDRCPRHQQFEEEVERLIKRPLPTDFVDTSTAHISFVARVTEPETTAHPTWRVSLESQSPAGASVRNLEGESCQVLADAVAVIIALALDARAGAPSPKPSATSTKAVTKKAREPLEPAKPIERDVPESTSMQFALRGEMSAGVGPLPRAGLGVGLSGSLLFGHVRLEGGFLYAFEQQQVIRESPEAGGALRILSGTARFCYQHRLFIDLGLCAGAELGTIHGEGFGVPQTEATDQLWLAFSAELAPSLELSPVLVVLARFQAIVPVSRPIFVLENLGQIHRPALWVSEGPSASRSVFPDGKRPSRSPTGCMGACLMAVNTASPMVVAHQVRARPTLEDIYDEHFEFVWRSVRRLGVPEAHVDDAVQDVFLVVHRRLADFEGRSTIKTWLFGIALRIAHNHRRGQRRRGELKPLPSDLVDTNAEDPLEAMAKTQAVRILDGLLDELDEEKRAVFVLAELEQMTAPEMAEALSIKVNTVYSRLRAARCAFEQALTRHRAREKRRLR